MQRRQQRHEGDVEWLLGNDDFGGSGEGIGRRQEEVWVRGSVGKGRGAWLEDVGRKLRGLSSDEVLRLILDWAMNEWRDGEIGDESEDDEGQSDESSIWSWVF